jgi:hypothetical protein
MRRTRGEIEALIRELATASATAESSLRGLHQLADSVGRDVEDRVRAGQGLREELSFLVDRASAIADRLAATPAPPRAAPEAGQPQGAGSRANRVVQAMRQRGKPGQPHGAAAADAGIAHQASDAERALMRALESAR